MASNKITILSTYANDKLLTQKGTLVSEQKGGPAFYFKQALKGQNFTLRTGPRMEVLILMTRKGEFGKVVNPPKPKAVPFSQIQSPYLLISTVLDEFDLNGLKNYRGKVFLDIQGYVRNRNDFGKKKLWIPDKDIFDNIFCLKGTEEELRNIPPQFIKNQKRKMLIITKGDRGWEIFAFGKKYSGSPPVTVRAKNTLGAGDTFIANFVLRFTKSRNITESAQYAAKRTAAFLASRNTHHHT